MIRYLAVFAACFIAASGLATAQTQQNPSPPSIQATTDEAQAKAVLTRMADYLAKAKDFSVTIDAAYDVVQDSGQKIEFGEVRHVLLSRPDGLRIDLDKRDGSKQQILFDGKNLTLYDPIEKIFAQLPRAGSVDDTIDFFVNDLHTRIPLSVLLVTSLPQALDKQLTEVDLVGRETVAGQSTDHLAARGKDFDVQVWIATGDEPVPVRVVITYKNSPGEPQFSATLIDWNFQPKVDPSAFTFVRPEGAESVAFMVPAAQQPQPSKAGR